MTLGGSLQWWVHFQQSDGGFTQKGKTVRKTKNGGFTFWAMVSSLQNPWCFHMRWKVLSHLFQENFIFLPCLLSVSRKLPNAFQKMLKAGAKSFKKWLCNVCQLYLRRIWCATVTCRRKLPNAFQKVLKAGAKNFKKWLCNVCQLYLRRIWCATVSLQWWVHFDGGFTLMVVSLQLMVGSQHLVIWVNPPSVLTTFKWLHIKTVCFMQRKQQKCCFLVNPPETF